jgi:hypothetical protein
LLEHAIEYWQRVIKRAWVETLPLTPWASWSKAFFHIAPAVVAAVVWYQQSGQTAAAGVIGVGIAAAFIGAIFMWKLITVPALMDREKIGLASTPLVARARSRPVPALVASNTGTVSFDYSTNDGEVVVGEGRALFRLKFSKASDRSIHFYRGSGTVGIARVKQPIFKEKIAFSHFDSSSRSYELNTGDIGLAENEAGYFMQLRIREIADDSRGAPHDLVVFEYAINGDGAAEFSALAM